MANDTEVLTSNETVSEPCRAATLRNISNKGPKQSEGEEVVKSEDSPRSMSYVKNENQIGDGDSVPNGCLHHRAVDNSIHAPKEETCAPSSTDHCTFYRGSEVDTLSHDISRLSVKTTDAASWNSSTEMFAKESVTSEAVNSVDLPQHQELVDDKNGEWSKSDDTKTTTEMLANTNDLPGVPSEMLNEESFRDVDEEKRIGQTTSSEECSNGIEYVMYESEKQMPDIMSLITKDLSEPYSIYTYRYFIHNWPNLCFLALHQGRCVGAIVCKLDTHKKVIKRGYIAMLAVAQDYRKRGIGSHLVIRAIKGMVADGCDEVVLETEITNKAALHLYENLGFVRDKRLFRYYLNGVDALRLKLWLK